MDTIKELRDNPIEILKKRIAEEKKKLHSLCAAHAIDPLKNPMRIRKTRRYIAQMKTVINENLNNTKALTDGK